MGILGGTIFGLFIMLFVLWMILLGGRLELCDIIGHKFKQYLYKDKSSDTKNDREYKLVCRVCGTER